MSVIRCRKSGTCPESLVFALLALTATVLLTAACTSAPGRSAPTTARPTKPLSSVTPSKTKTAVAVRPAWCPASWKSSSASLNSHEHPGSSTELIPPGAGDMTICRYAGLNQKVKFGTLEASHVVSGAELSDFVGLSDRQAVENGASFGCPMSQGSVDLLELIYATGPQVDVSVSIAGCSFASNGSRTVNGSEIAARLAAWVGSDPLPGA